VPARPTAGPHTIGKTARPGRVPPERSSLDAPHGRQSNPLIAAARHGLPGRMVSGDGPPSRCYLGSHAAISTVLCPRQAQFQSTSTTRSPTKQRLSLRTSKCTRFSPASRACASAAMRVSRAWESHVAEQSRSPKMAAGSWATCAHPTSMRRRASKLDNVTGGVVAATCCNVSRTCVMRSHGPRRMPHGATQAL
jgi:hypothetical protein